MGKLMAQPEEVRAALETHLTPGEQLQHAAYGLQQSALLTGLTFFVLFIPATLIAILLVGPNAGIFGLFAIFIVWALLLAPIMPRLRKDYLVGLTDQRLLVVRIKTPMFSINLGNVISITDYPLSQAHQAETKIGPMRVFIKLKDAGSSLKVQFGGRGLNDNYREAAKIASVLGDNVTSRSFSSF